MLGLWQELLVAWSSRVVQCIMTLDRSTYVHAGYVGHAVAVRNPQHAEKLSERPTRGSSRILLGATLSRPEFGLLHGGRLPI